MFNHKQVKVKYIYRTCPVLNFTGRFRVRFKIRVWFRIKVRFMVWVKVRVRMGFCVSV